MSEYCCLNANHNHANREEEIICSADYQVAALRAELDLTLKTHVFVSDEWNKAKKRLEKLEKRDEVWRAKKEMLENDLGEAWKRLEEAERDFGLFKKTNDELRAKVTEEFTKRRAAQTRAEEAERQLARYREFIKKLADVKHEPDKLLCLLEREALKAVEDSPKVTESGTGEE